MSKPRLKPFIVTLLMSLGFTAYSLSVSDYAQASTSTIILNEEVSYFTNSFELKGIDYETEGEVIYNAVPSASSPLPKDSTYQLVFNEEELGGAFPRESIEGRVLKVTGLLDEEDTGVLEVSDWRLYTEDSDQVSVLLQVESTQFQKDGVVTYFVTPLDGGEFDRITFKESVLGEKFPAENLVGTKLSVSGDYITSDSKNLSVSDWVPYDMSENMSGDVNTIEGETKTYYGEFQYAIGETMEEGTYVIDAKFVDFDGKEYIARFDSRYVDRMPDLYSVTFKATVEAEPKGVSGSHPVLQVKSYKIEEDNFEFKTDEVISTVGKIGKVINSSNGRMTYEFSDDSKKYIAVFDDSVLGDAFMNSSLEGKNLELTGVVYKEEDTVYLGVMGYRDPYKGGTVGSTGNGLTSYSFSGTITYLMSYTESESMYKVITSNGEEKVVVFTSELLKKNYPSQSLIGKSMNFVTLYKGKTLNSSTKLLVANYTLKSSDEFKQDRGKFLSVAQESQSAVIFTFESIEGGRYDVLLTAASVSKFGGKDALLGKVVTLYGKEGEFKGERVFDAYLVTPVNTPHFNQNSSETVTFTGFIQKVSQRDTKGVTFLVSNQYGESEYVYFETDFLEGKFPAALSFSEMLKTEVTVAGYRLSNGKIMVKDFAFPKVSTSYPNQLKPKYQEPDYFPNMKGFTGILDVSDIGGTQLMLITSSDKYILHGKPEVLKQIEENLRSIVYLRGEYREAGRPYWTGEIKVYDIKVLDGDTNTIIKPIDTPIGGLIPDPQKEAHHTIQLPTEKPKEYKYGEGIPEALYIPEPPMAKDVPILK